jgi:hypothetical protein
MDRKPVLNGSKTFITNGQHATPVAGLLIESRRRVLEAFRLALCNSGSTAGSRDRVVGYGAWMFGQAA